MEGNMKIEEPIVENTDIQSLLDDALSGNHYRRISVKKDLQKHEDKVIPHLREALSHDDTNVRWKAANSMSLLGPKAFDALLETYGSAPSESQLHVLWALGTFGDPRATDVLLTNLAHEDSIVRYVAVEGLGTISDPNTSAALRILTQDDSEYVRHAAEEALAKME